jgi:hypothetical protein
VIYLYGIGERHGNLTAFVRRGLARPPQPDEASLLEHDRVVSALMERGAVLPMRFGAVVSGEDDVRELLARRGDELRGQLAHVRGRVEMGVRATWDHAPTTRPPASGRDFMHAKLERRAAARRAANELHAELAELSVDSVLRLCPREDTAFTGAYLIDRAAAAGFIQRAGDVTVTGPWPPYSFSG